jgi:hypothetical protein
LKEMAPRPETMPIRMPTRVPRRMRLMLPGARGMLRLNLAILRSEYIVVRRGGGLCPPPRCAVIDYFRGTKWDLLFFAQACSSCPGSTGLSFP